VAGALLAQQRQRCAKNADHAEIVGIEQAADLLCAMIGVSLLDSGPDWQQRAKRLVDILIAGAARQNTPDSRTEI